MASIEFFTPLTVATIVVGLVITVFYLRYMWLALQRAIASNDEPEDGRPDQFGKSFAGAVIAVLASSAAITAYGLGPRWLYIGVVLALLSPAAVAYTLYRETSD
ncbi:hypothetical protein [Trinickia diaoshuihuensis]|uniref:hypothetical protein n=1 Tax=Trinickia diaoshuihuensis TaxID=2292265 RepID=UPI000E252E5A|nr:hypothetical protein [Trinickia diaoshuihuensis]